jgi:hypothetical protein
MPQATPTTTEDSGSSISFPAVGRKKLTAAFDGGRLTSDGGVLLLAQAGGVLSDPPIRIYYNSQVAGPGTPRLLPGCRGLPALLGLSGGWGGGLASPTFGRPLQGVHRGFIL